MHQCYHSMNTLFWVMCAFCTNLICGYINESPIKFVMKLFSSSIEIPLGSSLWMMESDVTEDSFKWAFLISAFKVRCDFQSIFDEIRKMFTIWSINVPFDQVIFKMEWMCAFFMLVWFAPNKNAILWFVFDVTSFGFRLRLPVLKSMKIKVSPNGIKYDKTEIYDPIANVLRTK